MRRGGLFAIVLWAAACGSGGGSSSSISASPDGGGAILPGDAGDGSVAPDAGQDGGGGTDAGPPDAGGVDAGTALPGGGDWPQYRHDALGGSENPAEFAAAEVSTLADLWRQPLDLGQYVYTQAVAAGGLVVYTTAFSGRVVGVDESTGQVRWDRTLNAPITTACAGATTPGFWGSAAVAGGVVYAAAPDGNAYALRASDGTAIWSARIADPTAAGHGEFVQSSPAVSSRLGRLYVGVASYAHCDEVAGRIVAVDLANGAVQSRRLVDSGQQGATIWSSIAIAEDENRLYATTGNRIGALAAEPNAQAFLALDPRTLEVLDRWQNPTALENADFGSSPALVDSGGLKLVAATSKDGHLYVLRRDALSAGPVWAPFPLAVNDPKLPGEGGDPTGGWGSISTPAVARGALYAAGGHTPAGEPGSVVAFEPHTGRVLWRAATPGYVIAPVAVAGEILAVESSAPDGTRSWLEVRSAADGTLLRRFDGTIATYAAPAIAHGAIFWTDAFGKARAIAAPRYRR